MKCPVCKQAVGPEHFACHSGAKGGSANTEAQNAARAKNAKKGGWPKGRPRKTKLNAKAGTSADYCSRCGMLRSECDCWDPVNQG